MNVVLIYDNTHMKIQTAITNINNGDEHIRGVSLQTLMRSHTFTETIFLILFGKLPTETEKIMFDAMLSAMIDHGAAVTSALNARVSVSAGNDIHTALAAGILGMGSRHGVAIGPAMSFFYEYQSTANIAELLAERKEKKQYVPGFGHKVLTVDERAQTLFLIAKQQSLYGKHCEFAQTVEQLINQTASKPLPINIDGAVAAILCDLGVDPNVGSGLFVVARISGLLAHVVEERAGGAGLRRLSEEEIEYVGR